MSRVGEEAQRQRRWRGYGRRQAIQSLTAAAAGTFFDIRQFVDVVLREVIGLEDPELIDW
jgi:hypothetical protein